MSGWRSRRRLRNSTPVMSGIRRSAMAMWTFSWLRIFSPAAAAWRRARGSRSAADLDRMDQVGVTTDHQEDALWWHGWLLLPRKVNADHELGRPHNGQEAHVAHGPAGAVQAGEGLVGGRIGVHGNGRTRRGPW